MIQLCSLTTLCLLFLSGIASAKNITKEEFLAIDSEYGLQSGEAYPLWNTGRSVCMAQTRCPNGRIVFCKTFASAFLPNHMVAGGVCRWMVIPGRAVRCQGNVFQRDFYGRGHWAYVDIPVSCF